MATLAPPVPDPESAPDVVLEGSIVEMVAHPDYPCLGARSVFRRDNATVRIYGELGGASSTLRLLQDLGDFAGSVDCDDGFASFIAVFRGPQVRDELHFEQLLWSQLRRLHEGDEVPWDGEVSDDPSDEHFAFSVAGTAFFIVGLHPQASRDARRAATPTLVFNVHRQFEELRESGQFRRMRDRIRERDASLQGSVNPMVSDHGKSSEARQYSGRQVDRSWQAPFDAEDQG